jgi:hypothetical protein
LPDRRADESITSAPLSGIIGNSTAQAVSSSLAQNAAMLDRASGCGYSGIMSTEHPDIERYEKPTIADSSQRVWRQRKVAIAVCLVVLIAVAAYWYFVLR